MFNTILLPFRPDGMTPAQLAAVSYLARYAGHTHQLYAYKLRRWFTWCETNRFDPRSASSAPTSSIRHLGETGLRASSTNTMMHGVRGFFRFAHIDGLIPPTRRSTPGCRKSTKTSRAPKDWTAWS